MRRIILFRGLPGSGKSTLSASLCEDVWSADMYFERTGEYLFDREKLFEAHQWCQAHTEKSMIDDVSIIGVANTFTQEFEMQSYFKLAEKYNYQISSVIVENRHEGQNIHDVPEETINKMRERFSVKL